MKKLLIVLMLLASGLSAASDPFFADVVLLVPFEGLDGSTTQIDQSNNGTSGTFVGNAQLDTAQFPTGQTSSLLLDGTIDHVRYPDVPGFDLGSDDFTIEIWIRWANIASKCLLGRTTNLPSGAWSMFFNSSLSRLRFIDNGNFIFIEQAWSPLINIFYAIALGRQGDSWQWWIDGIRQGSTKTDSRTITAGSQDLFIGSFTDQTLSFDGHIGPVRITKGVSRYDVSSDYTVPTLPLPTTGVTLFSETVKARDFVKSENFVKSSSIVRVPQ